MFSILMFRTMQIETLLKRQREERNLQRLLSFSRFQVRNHT